MPATDRFTDADYPENPYPGARPDGSFVHLDGVGRLVTPDAATPSGWRVAEGGLDLDAWLTAHDAPVLADRLPVLAYGSNACPAKITSIRAEHGLTGPVVVLAARCTGIAAVWAAGLRFRDGQRPATLAAVPDAVEDHAVWLATAEQVRALDACEAGSGRYHLGWLRSGNVRLADSSTLGEVLAYTSVSTVRNPLLVDGKPVRCNEIEQNRAAALTGEPGTHGLAVSIVNANPRRPPQ